MCVADRPRDEKSRVCIAQGGLDRLERLVGLALGLASVREREKCIEEDRTGAIRVYVDFVVL